MLVSELIAILEAAPSDAIIAAHVDHEIHLNCDEWSDRVTETLCDDFEVVDAVLSAGYNGQAPGHFLVLDTGKAI